MDTEVPPQPPDALNTDEDFAQAIRWLQYWGLSVVVPKRGSIRFEVKLR